MNVVWSGHIEAHVTELLLFVMLRSNRGCANQLFDECVEWRRRGIRSERCGYRLLTIVRCRSSRQCRLKPPRRSDLCASGINKCYLINNEILKKDDVRISSVSVLQVLQACWVTNFPLRRKIVDVTYCTLTRWKLGYTVEIMVAWRWQVYKFERNILSKIYGTYV